MYVRANFADIYLQGMSDRSMQSGMEIQLTVWSTAGEQGNLVFVVLTFHNEKKIVFQLSKLQINSSFSL